MMWIIKHNKLVSENKAKSTYIHKDQLIPIDTQGICQSLEIFCPATIKVAKLPWNKFWTIKTKDWVLTIIKLNGIAMTLAQPILFADIDTVQELYARIFFSDRQKIPLKTTTKLKQGLSFLTQTLMILINPIKLSIKTK